MKNYYVLLAATMSGNFTKNEIEEESSNMKDDISDYIQKKYSLDSKDEITKTQLEEYLKELLSQSVLKTDSNNDFESTLIDTAINMIAEKNKTSTLETEA